MGEHFVAGVGDEKSVFPLGGGFAVDGADGPAVVFIDDSISFAGIDHRLDGEGHAGDHESADIVIVVGDFGGFMEGEADSMTDKLVDYGAMVEGGARFDGLTNGANGDARFADGDGLHQAFVSGVNDPLFFFGNGSDGYHSAAIAKKSIDNAGDVDVENVSFLQRTLVRDAVTDYFIERGANGFGKWRLSVAKTGGDDSCFFMEFAREFVELKGGDTLFSSFADLIENLRGDLTGSPNPRDLSGGFNEDIVIA